MKDHLERRRRDCGLLREVSGYVVWYLVLLIVGLLMAIFLRDFSTVLHSVTRRQDKTK